MAKNGDEMAGVLQLIEDSRLTGYLAGLWYSFIVVLD
jgi:hypothetical protein